MSLCYCGSNRAYAECCEPFHAGREKPQTAEQLMRSRFSAFATANSAYILETEDAALHEGLSADALKSQLLQQQWVGLEVLAQSEDSVTFKATAIIDEKLYTLYEVSEFARPNGTWIYTNALQQQSSETKLTRNDTCPCGSGKKYKKCHYKG